MRTTHLKKRHVLTRLLLFVLACIILLPVIMTVLYSFFSPAEIKAFMKTRGNYDASVFMQIKLAPDMFSLSQYYRILIEDMSILRYFVNSAMYAAAILLGQALLIPMMAYALSRFRFPGRDALFFVVIMLMLLPFQVTMVPNVLTLRTLGLLNTVWAVILPMTIAPFYIFLLRQYMVGLPADMIEAAQIDGAGPLRCFIHVVLPVCQPILGAAAALSFADCWNLVEQPQFTVFAFEPQQLLLGCFDFVAQRLHRALTAGYLRLKEHIARFHMAALRHAHALDGHALVIAQPLDADILRLGKCELSAQLDLFFELALFGSHQLYLGGRYGLDRAGKKHAQRHNDGQRHKPFDGPSFHRFVVLVFSSLSATPFKRASRVTSAP